MADKEFRVRQGLIVDTNANVVGSLTVSGANVVPTLQSSFDRANTANATAIAAFGQANTANTTAIAAFTQANTANATAIAAFARANTALQNTTGTFAGTLTISNDLFVTGNVNLDTGTLFVDAVNNRVGIGTTTPTSNLQVIGNANVTTNLVVQGIDVNQFVGTAFNQANLALATAQSAFNQANTGGGGGGADVTARTTANLALVTAQSAFNQANTGGGAVATIGLQDIFMLMGA